MIQSTNDILSSWKDFPKGLRVLLLDEDTASASEMKSKLEAMDYIVSMFLNVNEAVSEVLRKPESFHVAIVEVSSSNNDERFKFLEIAKDLPTVMTSNFHCLSTMMKCIALGAVEFLRKPLSEDKLRNIWQHVVHKAFNPGKCSVPDSLKPVKHSVASILQLGDDNKGSNEKSLEEMMNWSLEMIEDAEETESTDKYTAPATPQNEQGKHLAHDGDTNCSSEKESGEQEGESKFVESTSIVNEVKAREVHPQNAVNIVVKNEEDCAGVVQDDDATLQVQKVDSNSSSGTRLKKNKLKVDWTPDLHKKFVQAVDQLGLDQAIPSRILELMKVEGLTRHNVASHLQKYRMHRRNIFPKHEERRWQEHRDQIQRNYYAQRPIMAYPTYHSGHTLCPSQVYPLWGLSSSTGHQLSSPLWGPPSYPPWTPAEPWTWKPYHGADAWGCPVMRPPQEPFAMVTSGVHDFQSAAEKPHSSYTLDVRNLQEVAEVVDEMVQEAINKPWLPLPLGLKPPSTESVLAELSRQGISAVPPLPGQHLL